MAFIVEDGTGIPNATSLVSVDNATAYLQDRNRVTENNWQGSPSNARQAALIGASDYLERRWGLRFLGFKRFERIYFARATLTMDALPIDGETITTGDQIFTWRDIVSDPDTEVLIGGTISETLNSLSVAINTRSVSGGGVVTANPDFGDTLVVEAKVRGTAGNDVTVMSGNESATWSSPTLIGGSDEGFPQPLSFPRYGIYSPSGYAVLGVPPKVKAAVIEYAVRANGNPLFFDPVIDPTGRAVVATRTRVGPIEEEIQYAQGSDTPNTVRPYPAADRLLTEYLKPAGAVVR